jgi:hypothetical protein
LTRQSIYASITFSILVFEFVCGTFIAQEPNHYDLQVTEWSIADVACVLALIRREWTSLSVVERESYINAVSCQDQNLKTKHTASFL